MYWSTSRDRTPLSKPEEEEEEEELPAGAGFLRRWTVFAALLNPVLRSRIPSWMMSGIPL
jgi:hypothetical protein